MLVQLDQRIFQVALKEHVAIAFATEGAIFTQNLIVKAVVNAPAHAIQQLASWLLDGFLF